jgi:hypothetical protein
MEVSLSLLTQLTICSEYCSWYSRSQSLTSCYLLRVTSHYLHTCHSAQYHDLFRRGLPELAQTITKVGKAKTGFVAPGSKPKPIGGVPGARGDGESYDHSHVDLDGFSFHALDSDTPDVATRVPPPMPNTSEGGQHEETNDELLYTGDGRYDNMEGNGPCVSPWDAPQHGMNDRCIQMLPQLPSQGLWSHVPCDSFPSNYCFNENANQQQLLHEERSSKFMLPASHPSGFFQESVEQAGNSAFHHSTNHF